MLNKVASADFSGVASIWNVKTGQRLVRTSLGGFSTTGTADAVAFNPSGTEVAVGYGNGVVAVFNARSGKELRSASIGSAVVYSVEFLGKSGELAIASLRDLALWRPQTGAKCCTILSSGPTYTIAGDPHNPQEFAVTTGTGVVIWNVSGSGKSRQQSLGRLYINDAEFSPDGSQVVTAASNGNVNIYDIATRKLVTTLNAGQADATTAEFSPDGKLVVAGY